jgi:TusA-related sulfurtransferase
VNENLKIDATLDCRGMSCPAPILRIKEMIQKMAAGEVLEMIATDPGSVRDMDSWSKRTGHEILETRHGGGLFRFYIRKKTEE